MNSAWSREQAAVCAGAPPPTPHLPPALGRWQPHPIPCKVKVTSLKAKNHSTGIYFLKGV